ncbi:MAG: YraN family protein [Alphaproteobacteria bacterium]|nr:MAG: YraN family protein [Alphaproteobacteria bacterium]
MDVAANNEETNYARGVRAEEEAARYLAAQGYAILRQRYKTKFGEIDLIVQKDNLLCFVEVKMRGNIAEALESITSRVQKRIENAALFFLSEHPDYMNYDMRFDVIAMRYAPDSTLEITHLDNAWEARS